MVAEAVRDRLVSPPDRGVVALPSASAFQPPTRAERFPVNTTVPTKPMHIVQLEAEAFKRLIAVSITPDGSLVEITGKNGQGKSSTLDAIMAALAGGNAIPDKPIRRGNKSAEIRVRLAGDDGEIIVKRRFTESGSTLTVTAADGTKFNSPQQLLDTMLGHATFDPMAFCNLPPREQVARIKAIAGLDEAFTAIDKKQAEVQVLLTAAQARATHAQTIMRASPAPDGPDEEESIADLSAEMEAAHATIEKHRKARLWLDDQRRQQSRIAEEVAQVQAQIKALTDRLAVLEGSSKAIETLLTENAPKVAAMVDPDVTSIRDRMSGIEESNRIARLRRTNREAAKALAEAEADVNKLRRQKENAVAERETVLAGANLPVKGLAFTEDGVTLHGQPWEQASSAEQLRASFGIAMATNPVIRVALVREGSLLDRDGLAELCRIAQEHQAQVWVERVTNGEQVGIVIEDGEVRGGGQ